MKIKVLWTRRGQHRGASFNRPVLLGRTTTRMALAGSATIARPPLKFILRRDDPVLQSLPDVELPRSFPHSVGFILCMDVTEILCWRSFDQRCAPPKQALLGFCFLCLGHTYTRTPKVPLAILTDTVERRALNLGPAFLAVQHSGGCVNHRSRVLALPRRADRLTVRLRHPRCYRSTLTRPGIAS